MSMRNNLPVTARDYWLLIVIERDPMSSTEVSPRSVLDAGPIDTDVPVLREAYNTLSFPWAAYSGPGDSDSR